MFGFGPAFWWGYPYSAPWYYPYPNPYPYSYPYYSGYVAPNVVVVPPVYSNSAPAPPAPPSRYYCQSAGAYYPEIQSCPENWVLVPPTPPQ